MKLRTRVTSAHARSNDNVISTGLSLVCSADGTTEQRVWCSLRIRRRSRGRFQCRVERLADNDPAGGCLVGAACAEGNILTKGTEGDVEIVGNWRRKLRDALLKGGDGAARTSELKQFSLERRFVPVRCNTMVDDGEDLLGQSVDFDTA